MTTCTRVGEDESGRAPIDLGMAAGKEDLSRLNSVCPKSADSSADGLLSENLRQRSSRLFPNPFSTRVGNAISHLAGSRDSGQQPSLRQPVKLPNGHRLVRSKSNLEEQGKELLQFEYFMGM